MSTLSLFQRSDRRDRWNFILFCMFLGVVVLFGGASRADVPSQLVVRLAAIVIAAIALCQIQREEVRRFRLPIAFFAAFAIVIALQLVPLPPGMWASLPGRELYADALNAAGLPAVWRPLSLTPDLTLNALLALLPAAAALLAMCVIDRTLYPLLAPVILIGIAASALIGLLQVGGASLYFYQVTNVGSAVGVFANRNHEALFLAIAFPLLAVWADLPTKDPGYHRFRGWLTMCAGAAIFPILLVTGSRAGLLLGVGSAIAAIVLVWSRRRKSERPVERWRSVYVLPALIGLVSIVAMIALARGEAVERFGRDVQAESRLTLLPTFVEMARDFAPVGSGFGSFDPVFRAYEPDDALSVRYLNEAHNDVAQVVIEGGLPALVLAAVFLIWAVILAWRVWTMRGGGTDRKLGRAGSIALALVIAASLVDYPLRTPLISVLLVIMCFWMQNGTHASQRTAEKEGLAGQD